MFLYTLLLKYNWVKNKPYNGSCFVLTLMCKTLRLVFVVVGLFYLLRANRSLDSLFFSLLKKKICGHGMFNTWEMCFSYQRSLFAAYVIFHSVFYAMNDKVHS